MGYDASGNRTSEEVDLVGTVTNATVTTSSYNAVNQLYSRTGSGNLPVRFKGTSSEPGTATVNGQSATITVNPASSGGRIFTGPANVPAGNQTVPVTATDLSGNTATKAYSLTVIGGTNKAYAYDNNGNGTTAGTATYDWDGADRLVAINNGPLRSEFTYDGFGRRVQMVEKNNGTVTGTKRLVWAGMALAEERSSLNAVTKRFFGGGEQIAGVNYYFARDHLGSVREMTDASGTVVVRYDYDPYGRRTKLSGGLDADFGYTGHYVHAPSGLYLTLFRAYDADSGRWLNRDPIQELGGLNLYGYVGNNPINKVDPLGLWGIAFGNNSGSSYVNIGWGAPSYYYSPDDYAPSQINGPVSGLAIYMLGDGDPVPLGPDLQAALQQLQQANPWPQTGNCPNQTSHLGLRDYGSWQHPYDDYLAEFSLGHFDYSNNGTTTTVSDVYAFPFTSSGTGLSSWRNTPYSWIPGTTYSDSSSWQTPNAHP